MKKFVAFYAADYDMEFFDSKSEAELWLSTKHKEDGHNDGFAEETIMGEDVIAEVISQSHFVVDDEKSNYHEHNEECSEECDEEEWGYEEECDKVGHVIMVPVPSSFDKFKAAMKELKEDLNNGEVDLNFIYDADYYEKIIEIRKEEIKANEEFHLTKVDI